MPVIGDEYYRCPSCGEAWFVEQRRFRIRRDKDLEFFSEEEAFQTPAPMTHAQIDYVCATCGEPLVRSGLLKFVRRPPVLGAALRQEIEVLKKRLEALEAGTETHCQIDTSKVKEIVREIVLGITTEQEETRSDGAGAQEQSESAEARQPDQPGGDPPADGDGTKQGRGKRRSK